MDRDIPAHRLEPLAPAVTPEGCAVEPSINLDNGLVSSVKKLSPLIELFLPGSWVSNEQLESLCQVLHQVIAVDRLSPTNGPWWDFQLGAQSIAQESPKLDSCVLDHADSELGLELAGTPKITHEPLHDG